MSNSDHKTDQWKTERLREERKARLTQMKDKDGGKKEIKTKRPALNIAILVVLFLVFVYVLIWAGIRTGLPHRKLTAAKVGPVAVHPVDISYYYHIMLSSYDIDLTTDEGQKMLQSPSGLEENETLGEYLKDAALENARHDVMFSAEAQKEGMVLTEANKMVADQYVERLKNEATQNNVSTENYLISVFGPGMNETVLSQIAGRILLADQYRNEKRNSFTFSADQLQSEYERDESAYDVVDFRLFPIAVEDEETDEDETKAAARAKETAEEMLSKITDEESFREQAIAYAPADEKGDYRVDDASLHTNQYKAKLSDAVRRNWLFDEDRKPGDTDVLETATNYYVIMFLNRQRPEFARVDIRHILIPVSRENSTDEEIDKAQDEAQSILEDFLAGDKSEEAFAQLAREHSSDGNAAQGGIYEKVYPGQMVLEFDEWCFSADRKNGDTGIVQTDFGFHVMYFIGQSGSEWEINVEENLRNKELEAFTDQVADLYPTQKQGFAYRFVG